MCVMLPRINNEAGTQHFLQDRMCAQRRLRSACAYAQADQSLRRALFGKPRSISIFIQTGKILIRLLGCASCFESSLGAHVILYELLCLGSNVIVYCAESKVCSQKMNVCQATNYEGPAKSFVTWFGLLQCYVLSNIFLLQTFKVFPLY